MNNDQIEFWVHTRPGYLYTIFLLNSIKLLILLIADLVIFPRHGWGRLNEPLSQNGTWISGIINFSVTFSILQKGEIEKIYENECAMMSWQS